MSDYVRLRYPMIVNYISMLYQILASMGFVVIVARKLDVIHFSLWGIVNSAALLVPIPLALSTWWARRDLARGNSAAANTAIGITLLYMVPASILYFAIAASSALAIGASVLEAAMGLPIALATTLSSTLGALIGVIKPEYIGYQRLVIDTARVALGYALVAHLRLGYPGAIAAAAISLALGLVVLGIPLARRGYLKPRLDRGLAMEWFRGYRYPLLGVLRAQMLQGTRVFASWATGNALLIAYLNISQAFQRIVMRASQAVSSPLSARALRAPRASDLVESIKMYFLFTTPVTIVLVVLSKPIVSLYNPAYLEAWPLMIVVAIYSIVLSLNTIYMTFVVSQWREREDPWGEPYKLIKLNVSSTLLGLVSGLALASNFREEPLEAAISLITALCIGMALQTVKAASYVRRVQPYKAPYRVILEEATAGLASASYLLAVGADEIIVRRFWVDAPVLGLHVLVAGLIYLGVLLLISPWARSLARAALEFSRSWHTSSK